MSNQRFLSTGATTGTGESENPVLKDGPKPNSEGGEKSGHSHQSKSDSGKPVRGGVNFLSQFFFSSFMNIKLYTSLLNCLFL